ncbi:cobyrinic acid a,c-diamide synthase [Saccharomonospora sp.]|uniref:cobyrinic acid a,c-diamide synthase n=1 Tax=Saccharomonospora sp. TaxID=33913 RepID=UPI00263479A4|nr:cobyrinic acid a,c-diamide synthase [Saccharomonospora sp.]
MTRRASLPGASELFRRTGERDIPTSDDASAQHSSTPEQSTTRQLARVTGARRGSGRQKHDAKITVYVSGEELLALEHARLELRGSHGLVVDRGRIVREAVAVLLADFDEHGEDSVLVRRLRGDDVPGADGCGEDVGSR